MDLLKPFIPEDMKLGILLRQQPQLIQGTLTAGRAHLKHTEGGDFRQATYRAVRQGLMCAESVLLPRGSGSNRRCTSA